MNKEALKQALKDISIVFGIILGVLLWVFVVVYTSSSYNPLIGVSIVVVSLFIFAVFVRYGELK